MATNRKNYSTPACTTSHEFTSYVFTILTAAAHRGNSRDGVKEEGHPEDVPRDEGQEKEQPGKETGQPAPPSYWQALEMLGSKKKQTDKTWSLRLVMQAFIQPLKPL